MADIPLRHDRNDADSPTATDDLDTLVAVVVQYDHAPDECTIFPDEADEDTLMTTWITAEEGSFVSLDEMR